LLEKQSTRAKTRNKSNQSVRFKKTDYQVHYLVYEEIAVTVVKAVHVW